MFTKILSMFSLFQKLLSFLGFGKKQQASQTCNCEEDESSDVSPALRAPAVQDLYKSADSATTVAKAVTQTDSSPVAK